jgi:AcrR family transcriptional regulator
MTHPTRRERLRERTKEETKAIARQQMQTQGTAAISLRAIAREMGMTVMALYRYYENRDALITALILDAFNALADTLEQASASYPTEAYAERLLAVLLAYREWALAHPVDFQLIYGNPIPGYHAPAELTVPAASRSLATVVAILAAALRSGELAPAPRYYALPPVIADHMATLIERDGYGVPVAALYIGVAGWIRIHGMIMLELFGHTPPVVGDPAEFYRFEVTNLMKSMGLIPKS